VREPATLADDDPFAPAAAAGVHRLAIPTPFAVGRVNVYLIDDEPLTLVDAGPNSGTSFDELSRGVDALGHALEDIELVVLTHQHIDHLGLVSLVADRSGAQVAASTSPFPTWRTTHSRPRPTTPSPTTSCCATAFPRTSRRR
jgi:glyoxylase-like metal-dependent hydrolase (beta-lactamase superfamily II)